MARRYFREGFQKATADLVQRELQRFERPEEVELFFSAHGVPVSYVEQVRPLARPLAIAPALHVIAAKDATPVHRQGRCGPLQLARRIAAHISLYSCPEHTWLTWSRVARAYAGLRGWEVAAARVEVLGVQDGDPYKEEMEQCVAMIMARLRARGVANHHTLAYQSRVGPVRLGAPSPAWRLPAGCSASTACLSCWRRHMQATQQKAGSCFGES